MKSVLFLLGTVTFSYLLNTILLRFSKNFGVDSRQTQNIIRWGSTSKPTTGGISFFITFLVGLIVLLAMRPESAVLNGKYLALLSSATLAFMIGFADDAYGTHPGLKFLGQVGCALILIFFDLRINFFVMWSPDLWLMDVMLTIFWVVGIMNSLNMLDNMDAVTTTIATTIVITTMAMIIIQDGLSNTFYILVAVAGGFIGFLFWNWKPAKIYMGDTGSMFIGMVLAYIGIMYFWNVEASPDNISHIRKGLIPFMVFIVPIMDTSFVTFARLHRGSSPFVGGKDHLTHHLAHIGIQEQMVPVTLGVISIISGMLAIFVYKLTPEWVGFYSILFSFYPIAVFTLFIVLYRRGGRIGRMKDLLAKRAKFHRELLAAKKTAAVMSNTAG